MANEQRGVEPLRGFRFEVSVNSRKDVGLGFQRVSGLQAAVGVKEWQEISDPVTVWKIPDRIQFSDVVLERGATTDRNGLWNWYVAVVEALQVGIPSNFRSTVTIRCFEKGASSPARIWTIFRAFPKTIKFSELEATSSNTLIESLVLANEGITYRGA